MSTGTGESPIEETTRDDPMPSPAPFALVLEPTNVAPRIARGTLAQWLLESSCPAPVVEDIKLLIDELVTNAFVHAMSSAHVVAAVDDGRVRIEVHDHSAVPLVVGRRQDHGGFGLQIVAALADHWGWSATPAGKFVWTEIRFADPTMGERTSGPFSSNP